MKDQVFDFLRNEILLAEHEGSAQRAATLKTIDGYLKAAKRWRAQYNSKRGSEYSSPPRDVDQFDLDCAISER